MKAEQDKNKSLKEPNYKIDIEIRFPEEGSQKVTTEKPKQEDKSIKPL